MIRTIAIALASTAAIACGAPLYSYELINDSADSLADARALDPNFQFSGQDLEPYQGGISVFDEGHVPKKVQVQWTRNGRAHSTEVDIGLDCPGRPDGPIKGIKYWIRSDDSVRTRLQIHTERAMFEEFVPCEPEADRARRVANQALEDAAQAGDVARIEAALRNAPVNPAGYFDTAPLHVAAGQGHLAAVTYLLDRGARSETQQRWPGQSALEHAITNGHLHVAELLVDSGANLNHPGSAPLLEAAKLGYGALVIRMLDRGADINLKSGGQSALVNAAREGRTAVVRVLLDRGADPNTTVGERSTALDIAEQFQQGDVANLLRSRGARRGLER